MTSPEDTTNQLSAALRGRDMLCFSHDWKADPLSKTHLMRLLARDNRVLWVNSIGYRTPTASTRDLKRAFKKLAAAASPVHEVEPNIHVLSPLVIPAYGQSWVRKFNRWFLRLQVRRAMRKLSFERPVNWVFNPAASMIAGTLGEDLLIYYCVDEYAAFTGVDSTSLAELEHELVAKADLVIASSERLFRPRREQNQNTSLVRHGVDWVHFRTALDESTPVPSDIAKIPGPILGYFGLMAKDWVDLDLLEHLARSLPHVSIVMLGRVTMDVSRLSRFPNIHVLGHRSYSSLPSYCKAFNAAIIPFPINDATLHSNPLKAREYLAAGLPVVSTAIPEVEALGLCKTAGSPEEFVAHVQSVLADPGSAIARSDSVKDQSWQARLVEIGAHVESARAHPRDSKFRDAPPQGKSTPGEHPEKIRLFQTIREDIRRKSLWCYQNDRPRDIVRTLCSDGTFAMVLYRLMQWSRRRRLTPLEMLFNRLNAICCNCIIGRGAEFGKGFVLIHATGVVINGAVRGGKGVHIEHQVTIGAERRSIPILGDDVFIGAGAKVLGQVTIGDGVRIGANAVVIEDVPAYHTAVGIPARNIPQTNPIGTIAGKAA